MASPNAASGTGPDIISASADGVKATLSRDSNGNLFLNLNETFTEAGESLNSQSLEQAVEQIQQREIDRVYRTLTDIQEQLAVQVRQDGAEIAGITRDAITDEHRDWKVDLDQITIVGFTTTTEEHLSKPDGISEASLLRASFSVIIGDRIRGIRDIYRRVRQDILSPRQSSTVPNCRSPQTDSRHLPVCR